MSKIKVGVVGLGHMGKFHARIYSEMRESEFVAVYDNDRETARKIAQQYGVRAVDSLGEFADAVDAATIATPTPWHFEIAKTLLGHGKHLLIEKPIAETAVQAKELVSLAHERERVLQVGHVERFNPVLDALEKKLAHPRFIESHRLSPYPNRSVEIGVVLDLMIHDLEIILHLVRSPVASIDAVGASVIGRSEDIANAHLRFENGCVANITVSRVNPERVRKIRVFQEDAYLSLDYQKQWGEIYRLRDGEMRREDLDVNKGDALTRQLQSFVNCCTDGAKPKVSGREAAVALELAIEISQRIEAQNKKN